MRRELFACPNFRWIDVAHPTEEELESLRELYNLPPHQVQDTLDPIHLPKFERVGSISFLIMRIFDVESDLTADTIRGLTRKIGVFIGPSFIITVHRLDPDYFQGLVENCLSDFEGEMVSDMRIPPLLVKFLNKALQSYRLMLEIAENELDGFEFSLFDREADIDMFKDLHIIRRRLALAKRIFLHSQDVVVKLSPSSDTNYPLFQDLKEQVTGLIFMTDELLEDATSLLSLQISLASQRTNEVVRVLTVFSVFFMPLTFIAGVYGMNFKVMPELNWRYGYLFACGIMILVTCLIGWWFYRKGWLKFFNIENLNDNKDNS
jgi:magnesium transporter